jgi:hypothetical protein
MDKKLWSKIEVSAYFLRVFVLNVGSSCVTLDFVLDNSD